MTHPNANFTPPRHLDDPPQDVLSAWETPSPDDDKAPLRPKQFKLVRLSGGRLAVRKTDSAPEYIAYEASILEALQGVDCVPPLLHQSESSIYTLYVEGPPLSEAIPDMESGLCLKAGWQVFMAVAAVHARGVVHADIRPWNFIYGRDARVYLFDFEYSYLRQRKSQPVELLARHHVLGLRSSLSDWTDSFRTVADLWQLSPHPIVSRGLSLVPACFYWGLRVAQLPRQFALRGLRFLSRHLRRSAGSHGI